MENQPQPNEISKTTAWVVLIVIVIILGVGTYFLFFQEEGTNTNNANTIVNINTATNTNSTTNTVANTNTEIDTSDWLTYTNSEYGYTLQYPSDWTVEEKTLTEDPLHYLPPPLRGVYFYGLEKKYLLRVGIMKKGDEGAIILSSGIGGNVIDKNDYIKIMNKSVEVTKVAEDNRVTYSVIPVDGGATRGAVLIQDYEFKAEFFLGPGMTFEERQASDLQGSTEEQIAYRILESLSLP